MCVISVLKKPATRWPGTTPKSKLHKAVISAPRKLYSFSVASAKLNLTDGELAIDSFKIIPFYTKRKFMRLAGKQTDRIAGVIPKLRIHGLRFSHTPNLVVRALSAELNFRLDVFRDKRYRFIKNYHTRLPMNFLQKLPFKLQTDTLRLTDSYVKYEEFPENADSAGYVYFDHLKAVITNIHNDPALNQEIVMNTQAEFMGKGDLNVRFTFPADTTKACKTTGSLRGFELARLNTMLGPAAKVRIESGIMTNLKFNFAYTMKRSDGLVEINYKNLKVSSLREKDDKAAISVVKTLVLNTFIIKKIWMSMSMQTTRPARYSFIATRSVPSSTTGGSPYSRASNQPTTSTSFRLLPKTTTPATNAGKRKRNERNETRKRTRTANDNATLSAGKQVGAEVPVSAIAYDKHDNAFIDLRRNTKRRAQCATGAHAGKDSFLARQPACIFTRLSLLYIDYAVYPVALEYLWQILRRPPAYARNAGTVCWLCTDDLHGSDSALSGSATLP